MKRKAFQALIALSAVAFLVGTAAATNHTNNTSEEMPEPPEEDRPTIDDDIVSYNFALLGVAKPAADAIERSGEQAEDMESEGEVKIDRDRDDNDNITVNKSDAEETAREALSTPSEGEWILEDSETEEEDGYYEFEFVLEGANNTEGEAEVRVDGSTGEVFRHEEEVEREVEKEGEDAREAMEGGAVSLKGHLAFRTGGFEVETEEEQEDNSVTFTVEVESPGNDSMTTQQLDRKSIAESVEVESGTYDATVNVVKDGEQIHSESKQVNVRTGMEENETSGEAQRQALMKKSKKELVNMILALRGDREDHDSDGESGEQETEDSETEEEGEAESGGTEAEAEVEQEGSGKQKRPGFVGKLIGSVFGGR